MSPCICIDDSHSMFKVITGAHYWNPIIITRPKKGDIVFFEIIETGVHISLTNNKDSSFMFLTQNDFHNHFEDLSVKRENNINRLLD